MFNTGTPRSRTEPDYVGWCRVLPAWAPSGWRADGPWDRRVWSDGATPASGSDGDRSADADRAHDRADRFRGDAAKTSIPVVRMEAPSSTRWAHVMVPGPRGRRWPAPGCRTGRYGSAARGGPERRWSTLSSMRSLRHGHMDVRATGGGFPRKLCRPSASLRACYGVGDWCLPGVGGQTSTSV